MTLSKLPPAQIHQCRLAKALLPADAVVGDRGTVVPAPAAVGGSQQEGAILEPLFPPGRNETGHRRRVAHEIPALGGQQGAVLQFQHRPAKPEGGDGAPVVAVQVGPALYLHRQFRPPILGPGRGVVQIGQFQPPAHEVPSLLGMPGQGVQHAKGSIPKLQQLAAGKFRRPQPGAAPVAGPKGEPGVTQNQRSVLKRQQRPHAPAPLGRRPGNNPAVSDLHHGLAPRRRLRSRATASRPRNRTRARPETPFLACMIPPDDRFLQVPGYPREAPVADRTRAGWKSDRRIMPHPQGEANPDGKLRRRPDVFNPTLGGLSCWPSIAATFCHR